jgi:hypothetical protein
MSTNHVSNSGIEPRKRILLDDEPVCLVKINMSFNTCMVTVSSLRNRTLPLPALPKLPARERGLFASAIRREVVGLLTLDKLINVCDLLAGELSRNNDGVGELGGESDAVIRENDGDRERERAGDPNDELDVEVNNVDDDEVVMLWRRNDDGTLVG